MSIVLKNQVEASERSAQELDLQGSHDRALLCRDIEALIDMIVETLADMNQYVERWQSDIEGGVPYVEADARALFDLYVRLERTFLLTSQLIRRMEQWGFDLEEKPAFFVAWREIKGIVCFSIDRVNESFDQVRRGQTRTLGEFADELSRDLDR
jgi:hypothetical protein